MVKEKTFENYPAGIVFTSNLVSLSIYLIGAFLIYKTGIIWLLAVYLALIGIMELRLIRWHCTDCYYYGKTCAFGKGKLSGMLFKKGDSSKFCKMKITWKDIVPDFAISLVPAVIGIILVIRDFDWILLSLVLVLFVLTFMGNSFIRSQLACKHCKQRELGCPAQKLFEKRGK